jgi:multiple antibiotic resistance protein
MSVFLLAFPALFSIVNPFGNTFTFMNATRNLDQAIKNRLARKVPFYGLLVINLSVYVGAYILTFFGISVPVLRVAGGIVISLTAWRNLKSESGTGESSESKGEPFTAERADSMAFYPLTFPLATGPGTISVAISLGTNRPQAFGEGQWLSFVLQIALASFLTCLVLAILYRHSHTLVKVLGKTGSAVIMRVMAFILLCIGLQILWGGISGLVTGLR